MTLIVDMNGRRDSLAFSEFVEPVRRIAGDAEVAHFSDLAGTMPKTDGRGLKPAGRAPKTGRRLLETADRIILCGTPLKDVGYMGRLEDFKWLKRFGRPVLGICAGMQAIAAVHGAKLEKCQEVGMTEVSVLKENPLMSGTFKAYGLHNFAAKVPRGFAALAESKACVQAIAHKKRPLYGVLFHPEVRNPEIIERFLQL
jgi:GMP synthase-like glutamine amidotransferase